MRISDWSSDVCSSDLGGVPRLRQVGHVEHQDAAGVAGGDVVIHVGADAVLDPDPGHVLLGAVAAHHHVLRLADVDAATRGAAHHRVLDHHVPGLHRVLPVVSVVDSLAACPSLPHPPDADVFSTVALGAVACPFLNPAAHPVTYDQ